MESRPASAIPECISTASNRNAPSGVLLILTSAVLWSLLGPIARVALTGGMSAGELAFWRSLFGAVLFIATAAASRQLAIDRRGLLFAVLFGLISAVMLFVYGAAVQQIGAALSSALVYTAAAWVAVVSWALGTRLSRLRLLTVALAVAGALLIGLSVEESGGLIITAGGLLLGVLGGGLYAAQILLGKQTTLAVPTLFSYALPVSALFLVPQVSGQGFTVSIWLAALGTAVCATWLGPWLYYAGLKRMDATRAAALVTIDPVLTAIVAWLTWGERLPVLGYLGAALIVSGALLAALDRED